MDKDLDFAAGLANDGPDFVERQFPRQIDTLDTKTLRQLNTLDVRNTHLGAAMQLHVRSNLADQPNDAIVLHDHRVRSGLDDGGDRPRSFQQLVFENQRIKGDESAHASRVQSTHRLRQLIERKSHLRSCRKVFQTKIDRVRASLNRGMQLWPIAGRTHNLRLAWG